MNEKEFNKTVNKNQWIIITGSIIILLFYMIKGFDYEKSFIFWGFIVSFAIIFFDTKKCKEITKQYQKIYKDREHQ